MLSIARRTASNGASASRNWPQRGSRVRERASATPARVWPMLRPIGSVTRCADVTEKSTSTRLEILGGARVAVERACVATRHDEARTLGKFRRVRGMPGTFARASCLRLGMATEHALIELAYQTRGLAHLREGVLELLCSAFEAQVGLFVAIERGREMRALRGLSEEHQASLDAVWQEARREVNAVKEQALLAGAATDRRVLGASLTRTKLFQRVMASATS